MIRITLYDGTVYETDTISINIALDRFTRANGLHQLDIKLIERID